MEGWVEHNWEYCKDGFPPEGVKQDDHVQVQYGGNIKEGCAYDFYWGKCGSFTIERYMLI